MLVSWMVLLGDSVIFFFFPSYAHSYIVLYDESLFPCPLVHQTEIFLCGLGHIRCFDVSFSAVRSHQVHTS